MVDKYQVKPVMPIGKQIISKHGDIFKNCTVVTTKYRSKFLEMICNIIVDLQEKKFSEIKEDHLQDIVLLLDDMKNKNVDVEWLHQRLVEILQARQVLEQASMLKREKECCRKKVENAEIELKEREKDKEGLAALLKAACAEVTDCKEKLAAAMDESARINTTIADSEAKVNRYLNCSLVDDLL
ncbi:putative phospholipase [Lupinus albus]|uniref:Putative phospholipase n=1 Tax=Lupinus albus TaxID=3870 RepID=A0A6A4QAD6_LUPAL|nr:putative phospholipase [Lupinus albus]